MATAVRLPRQRELAALFSPSDRIWNKLNENTFYQILLKKRFQNSTTTCQTVLSQLSWDKHRYRVSTTRQTFSPNCFTSRYNCSRILSSSLSPWEVAPLPLFAFFSRFRLSSIFFTDVSMSDVTVRYLQQRMWHVMTRFICTVLDPSASQNIYNQCQTWQTGMLMFYLFILPKE